MKLTLLTALLFCSCFGFSQWYPTPSPLHKKDFTKIASNKYTVAFEYEVNGEEKTLTRFLEFGAQGLPAGLYAKGTNENGDSIDITETIYKFDGAGRLIKETNEDREEGSEWTTVYTYGKDGKLLKKQTASIDPPTTTYTYQNGKVVKTLTTQKMPLVEEDGESHGKVANIPQQKETYVYDKGGLLKEIWIYNLFDNDGGKKWSRKIRFSYNDKKQLIKRENLDEEEKVYNTETYEYNKDGLLVKATVKGDNDDMKTYVYEYCTTCKQSWMK